MRKQSTAWLLPAVTRVLRRCASVLYETPPVFLSPVANTTRKLSTALAFVAGNVWPAASLKDIQELTLAKGLLIVNIVINPSGDSHLVVHEQRHTGANVFRCGQCNKGFPRKMSSNSMKNPYRSKPYECGLCGNVLQGRTM